MNSNDMAFFTSCVQRLLSQLKRVKIVYAIYSVKDKLFFENESSKYPTD